MIRVLNASELRKCINNSHMEYLDESDFIKTMFNQIGPIHNFDD